jgi:AbrB family looped-hinge helix DNA binding protein
VKNGERNPIVGAGGRITLPKAVREAANLREGDALQLRVTPDGVLLCRAEDHDPDQWWFWTEEWQKKEREADQELRDPNYLPRILSSEEFFAELQQLHEEAGQ